MNNDSQNGQPPPAGHPSIPPQYARYQQQHQQQQQDSQLAYLLANAAARNQERRLSAAAAYGANGNGGAILHGGGFYGPTGGTTADDRLALAVALQEERNTKLAIATAAARAQQQQQQQQQAQQQQQLAMALHCQQQQQAALHELQRLAPQSAIAAGTAVAYDNNNPKSQEERYEEEGKNIDSDSDNDNDSETIQEDHHSEDDEGGNDSSPQPQPTQPRGKPEAMAKKLASAVRRQVILEELESEKQQQQQQQQLTASKDDAKSSKNEKVDNDIKLENKSNSTPSGTDPVISSETPTLNVTSTPNIPLVSKKKKTPSAKKKKAKKSGITGSDKKSSDGANRKPNSVITGRLSIPTMDDHVVPITETEYGKLEALMEQFCRVPLLAEFSRPVALLHPELMNAYTKIVDHPVDLGKVCRRIRRRQYENLRDVRLDAWRIFANCLKYHSHPSNKDAVPSFVSIALHLRDLFNDLWQEHMLGSDFPPPPPTDSGGGRLKVEDPLTSIRSAMRKRVQCRKKRLIVSGLSVMAGKCLERAAEALNDLIENGGLVDPLDTQHLWGEGITLDDDDEGDLEVVLEKFKKLETSLREIVANNEELGVDELETNVRKCYTEGDGLENMNTSLRIRIASRMDRYLGQLVVPIHEATCRGVSQSSVWGCMAAAVWARESSKKPFWPALVLGIIAPEDQKEDWHKFLTERNEARLPEKLKSQLLTGKRKAEQAVKRQSLGQADPQSFFLVEFLGSHEFIWVREADIVENFNAADDPNKKDISGHRTKKVSRKSLANILGSKTYANAIEEAQWALEEFELQLQDIGGPVEEDEDEDEHEEEEGYSYSVLSQSDDEADGETDDDDLTSDELDVDECNELLASNGLLDFSAAGRRKRAQILKQQKLDTEKKQKNLKAKKAKADKAKKAKDVKMKEKEKRQEKRDLDKKRRKRMREREKALKGVQHQVKKRKLSDPAPGRRHLIISKRERASAIVNAYVSRASQNGDYKPLGLGGDQKWIQSSLIDSTNLSGMALAFRASAGLIPMPRQDTGAPGKIILKPWDIIRLKGKKTSAERFVCLQKQIEILEREIQLAKASKGRRVERLRVVQKEVDKMNASIKEDDKLARENPLKKSKKPHPLAGKKRKRVNDTKKNNVTEKSQDDDNGQDGLLQAGAANTTEKMTEEVKEN